MHIAVRKPVRKRGVRLLFALLFVIGTTVSLSLGTQHYASAASCLTSNGNYTYTIASGCDSVEVYSKCQTFGSYSGTNAVECADIYATNDNGNIWVWGEGEFSCQGEQPQCAGMNVSDSITGIVYQENTGTDDGFGPLDSGGWQCNPNAGACPNGGHKELGTPKKNYQAYAHHSVQYTSEPAGEAILINGAPSTSKSTYFATPQITIDN